MEPGGSENRFDEKCLSSDFNSEENDSFELEENLWKRLKDERFKEGYKDGTFLGNEHALQKGFHFGYQQTIKQLYQMAKLKSAIEAAKEWICTPETGEELEHEYILLDKEFNEDWKGYVEYLKCANASQIEEFVSGCALLPVDRSEKLCENQAGSASADQEPSALRGAEATSSRADAKRADETQVSDRAAEEHKTVDLAEAAEEDLVSHESIAAGVLLALKSECELNRAVLDDTGMTLFNKYLQRLEMLVKSNN